MSFQEFTSLLNDLEHGAKAMQKAHKLELLRLEREERTTTLCQAAKDLKARGASQEQRICATTSHPLSPPPSTLTFQIVGTEQGIPHLLWLAATHQPVPALLAPISYERRLILKALADSPKPLDSAQVASRTELKIGNVRKMLARLLHAGAIASPARGSYTSLTQTPLPTIPSATPVPNVANVPNNLPAQEETTTIPHDKSPHEENNPILSEIPVPMVSNVLNDQLAQEETATISQDENPQEETAPMPSEKSVPMVSNVPTELPGREENSITPTESVLRPGPTQSQET